MLGIEGQCGKEEPSTVQPSNAWGSSVISQSHPRRGIAHLMTALDRTTSSRAHRKARRAPQASLGRPHAGRGEPAIRQWVWDETRAEALARAAARRCRRRDTQPVRRRCGGPRASEERRRGGTANYQ